MKLPRNTEETLQCLKFDSLIQASIHRSFDSRILVQDLLGKRTYQNSTHGYTCAAQEKGWWLNEKSSLTSICTYFKRLFHWHKGRNILLARSHQLPPHLYTDSLQSVAKTMSHYRIIIARIFPGIIFIPPQNMYNFMLVKCTQRYNCHWLHTESQVYLTGTHLKHNWFSRAAFVLSNMILLL